MAVSLRIFKLEYDKNVLFRPKVKLLTEEEYQSSRNEETRKALEEWILKIFCVPATFENI